MESRPPTILVVDDEPKNVKLLEAQLLTLGYDVVKAFNGAEALKLVDQQTPDLILLDVMMPVMNGFDVCKQLKDHVEFRLIPIVIMTALDDIDDRVRGIEAGADDFLTKPVNFDELMARIRTCLKHKQAIEHRFKDLVLVRDHYSKFVPEAVKRLVMENPQAPSLAKHSCDISVLFLDIVGYTRLNETYDSEQVNQIVELYFSKFLDRIHSAGGDITDSSGDGLMVIFQHSDPEQHSRLSAETALALFDLTEQLNVDNTLEPLALHMGLNSGKAFVGSTRFEGQRGTRWVFTADGPVTILAARLAGIAGAGELLLGPESIRRLAGRYAVEARGPTYLKNISEPVEINLIRSTTACKQI